MSSPNRSRLVMIASTGATWLPSERFAPLDLSAAPRMDLAVVAMPWRPHATLAEPGIPFAVLMAQGAPRDLVAEA